MTDCVPVVFLIECRHMDTVLFITDLHVGAHVPELAGVFDRAFDHHWRVIEIELQRTSRSLQELIRQWRPKGCIMECSRVDCDLRSVFKSIPVVYLDPDPKTAAYARHTVANDPAAVSALAGRELSLSKPASYLYVGWCTPTTWSLGREETFRKWIRANHGQDIHVYDRPWPIGETLEFQRHVAEFMRKLPKPIGIFAVNDYVGIQVIEACRLNDMVCPRDFTLVSVDNEEMHCESTEPTMTSIEQDFRGGGHLAADLLAELIANPRLPPKHPKFGPVRLARRQSSRFFTNYDPRIARAIEKIRRDATTGLTAADVLAEIPLSRRLAEKRFFAATGKTILEEIHAVRLEKVFELLRTDIPIGHIAGRCGMQSDSFLKRFFKAKTGKTLREWRKEARRDG